MYINQILLHNVLFFTLYLVIHICPVDAQVSGCPHLFVDAQVSSHMYRTLTHHAL